jgi:enoyl-CoA hydratase/carnithine racemase
MEYKHILYQPARVARIILNRPRYLNAQSRLMIEEMDEAFEKASDDDEVKVIVLSGMGEHFSAGHDLGTPEEVADNETRGFPTEGIGVYKRFRDLFVERTLRWRNLPKPTIAMVQGYCIFGGWIFASAMDIIFASEDALFLPSHTQYFPVPWDLGARKTKEVLFEHRFITAAEALENHFINKVFPREKLEEKTMAYAERVAENDPFQVRMVKYSVNHMLDTMGFTSEIEGAYQTYFVNRFPTWSEFKGVNVPGKNLANADRALKNLKASQE